MLVSRQEYISKTETGKASARVCQSTGQVLC